MLPRRSPATDVVSSSLEWARSTASEQEPRRVRSEQMSPSCAERLSPADPLMRGSPCEPPAQNAVPCCGSRAVKSGILVDLARKEALSQRAEGNKAYSELFESRNDLSFRLP